MKLKCFGCISFFLGLLLSSSCFASEHLLLQDILAHQVKNHDQSKILKNKADKESITDKITFSPWLTEISSGVEFKSQITESFTNAPTNITDSMPWTSKINQKTPYGFSLSLDYYRELENPSFQNVFQAEHLRGALNFSLYADFLGRSSRKITSGVKEYEELVKKDFHSQNCLKISLQYFEAASLERNLEIVEESIRVVKALHKEMKRAVKRGAVSKLNRLSLEVDLKNLEIQKDSLRQKTRLSKSKLKEVSNINFDEGAAVLKLRSPNLISIKSLEEAPDRYENVEKAKEELRHIRRGLAKDKVINGRDIKLYGGVESRKFSQNTINVDGKTNFSFIGVLAQWRFGDQSRSKDKKILTLLESIKISEISSLEKIEKERFRDSRKYLKELKRSHKRTLQVLKSARMLERKAVQSFKSGRTRYSDFLSTRNQIANLKKSEIGIKKDFWDKYSDHLLLKGDLAGICGGVSL